MTVLAVDQKLTSVLVTGTSSGIGQATTLSLRDRAGACSLRNPDKKEPLEMTLVDAGVRGQVEVGQLDVTDLTSMQTAVGRVLSRTDGRLDAVVHNAGIAVGAAFEDLPDSEFCHNRPPARIQPRACAR